MMYRGSLSLSNGLSSEGTVLMDRVSKLTKAGTVLLATLLLAILVNINGFAQSPPPGNQDTVLTFVHDLLRAFFPDILVKGNQLILGVSHPADASWREIAGVYFKAAPFSKKEPNPLTQPN